MFRFGMFALEQFKTVSVLRFPILIVYDTHLHSSCHYLCVETSRVAAVLFAYCSNSTLEGSLR